jgi:Ca2+-binding EF-hand superfamily protein
MPTIQEKILSVCRKNGWIGLRKLRTFFRNLKGRKSDKIKRVDLKYYLIEFGIFLSDTEISYIYQVFDENRKDEINYMTLFDNLIVL